MRGLLRRWSKEWVYCWVGWRGTIDRNWQGFFLKKKRKKVSGTSIVGHSTYHGWDVHYFFYF